METLNPGLFLLLLLLVWNVVLTLLFLKIVGHYRRLTGGVEGENLEKILEQILATIKNGNQKITKLETLLAALKKASLGHFQKMALVKFNPFSDMGGSQSFSLALLDGDDSGLVITGLHGRSLTHLYPKIIKKGKPVEGKLSEEEERAVKQCLKKEKRKESE